MLQYLVFLILAPIAAVACIGALVAAHTYRKRTGFVTIRAFLLSQFLFLIGNCIELIDPTETGTLFWAKFNYLFICTGPVLWFLFALEYAGRSSWLRWKRAAPLFALPACTFAFVFANDSLHLIWREYHFQPVWNMLVMRVTTYGPWLWVHFAYGYALMLSGGYIILKEFFESHSFYRKQSSLIVVGVLLPLFFNFVYLLKLIPGFTKDFSPISFALGGVCFIVGIMRFRLSKTELISRRELIDAMSEGVIVVDGGMRLIDINPSASCFFEVREDDVIGTDIRTLIPSWGAGCLPTGGEAAKLTLLRGNRNEARAELLVSALIRSRGSSVVYRGVIRELPAEVKATEGEKETEEGGEADPGEGRPRIVVDSAGKILASSMLANILDYQDEKLLGKDIHDIMIETLPSLTESPEDILALTFIKRTGEKIETKAKLHPMKERHFGEGARAISVIDMKFPRSIFSFRENQIIDLLAFGYTNKEIGDKLCVSENTVKAHLKNMYRKTGANRKSHLLHMISD